MARAAGEDLCAADYVRMLLLNNFKGRTDVERLENYIKRNASADIKAVLQCAGGLRRFLAENHQIFSLDSVSVAVNQKCRPSKENDVIKRIDGRLRTSSRRILSTPSLQTIVQRGPQSIQVYFTMTCPTIEKLREWFLQRTQLFRETPSGNNHLSELLIPLSGNNPMWLTVDFFVKILDEHATDSSAIDWPFLFNYVFVAESPAIIEFVTGSFEESTFEKFFRSHAEQFGLESASGELKRYADPANSGVECPLGVPAALSDLCSNGWNSSSDSPLGQAIEKCKSLFHGRTTMSVSEFQLTFLEEAPRPLFNFTQNNYPAKRFVDLLAANDESFLLSDNRQKVQLRENVSLWRSTDGDCGAGEDAKRNLKFDKALVKFFTDLLTMAAREQGVRRVAVEKLCNCVQLLPKNLVQYTIQTYRPPSQLFEGRKVFCLNNDHSAVGLRGKVVPSSELDTTAVATMSVNFFIASFRTLAEHNVRFVQPKQLDLLTCMMNPATESYLTMSFGKGQLKVLLHRFPAIFSQSKTGNLYLKKRSSDVGLDPASEMITKIKAICSNIVEGSALEFFLYEVEARRAYCYPVPISWCAAILGKASRSVSSYISDNFTTERLEDFFAKFPAVFGVAPELGCVYLPQESDWNNNANDTGSRGGAGAPHPPELASALRMEKVKVIIGLVAARCLAKCDHMAVSGVFDLARRYQILADLEAVLAKEVGKNKLERLLALLDRFSVVLQLDASAQKVTLQWPASYRRELRSVMEATLSRVVQNVVVQQSDEQGRIPLIVSVFEAVQRICSDGLFLRVARTLSDFLEFLDGFPAIFIVNGSTNTIAVRGHRIIRPKPADLSMAPLPHLTNGQAPSSNYLASSDDGVYASRGPPLTSVPPPGHQSFLTPVYGSAVVANDQISTSPMPDLAQWVEQKTALLRTWPILSGLLRKFVMQMDLETITRFAALQALVDGVAGCVEELNCVYVRGRGQDWVRAQKLMELYAAKNAAFADFALTAEKIVAFVSEQRSCQQPACKCRCPADLRDLEGFIYFCQSVLVHLEEGPIPCVLTSSSSSSNLSTPDILNRLCTWSDSVSGTPMSTYGFNKSGLSHMGGLFASLEERTYEETTERLVYAAREQLGLDSTPLVSLSTPSCWPRSIWEPEPDELSATAPTPARPPTAVISPNAWRPLIDGVQQPPSTASVLSPPPGLAPLRRTYRVTAVDNDRLTAEGENGSKLEVDWSPETVVVVGDRLTLTLER
ncbi:hypothetical protein BIW11_02190 [Tropilaelaps mercedesae]|uniref:Uncharacterized protein n=1 Tax=Tropilaelaps mercedesae TaxID=418985 RepID=A0A1V9X1N3_9ACAR|nr:hypothetical protein BIW11_02190 [Tropilaelaps mercedesae]